MASPSARGIEVSFVDRFKGLPTPFDGFGVDANVGYTDSGGTLRTGETRVLPGTFNWTANGAVFYEAHGVNLRLSAQYESKVLFGIGGDATTDVFQDTRTTLDLTGSYQIMPNVTLYGSAKNLTDAPLRFYERASNRPIQREFYGATLEGGVKVKI